MNGWFVFLIVVAVIVVWFFCAIRVREDMRRRCNLKDNDGDYICDQAYMSDLDAHLYGVLLGFLLGPIMLALVYAYELADGTSRRRIRAWRKQRSVKN